MPPKTTPSEPTLKPFKFLVQGVAIKSDGDKVLGEVTTEPVTIYGVEDLKEWAEKFEENLARAAAEQPS